MEIKASEKLELEKHIIFNSYEHLGKILQDFKLEISNELIAVQKINI